MSAVSLKDIKNFTILADIDETYLLNLAEQMQFRSFERKQYVVKKGDSAKEVFFLSWDSFRLLIWQMTAKKLGFI